MGIGAPGWLPYLVESAVVGDVGGECRIIKTMNVSTLRLTIRTEGHTDVIDITEKVQGNLEKAGLQEGTATVFVVGSTGGISTVEYEPGLVGDLKGLFDRVAPEDISYGHEEMWHDGNGHSHVRATLLGPSLSVPFEAGKLILGTWQQIVFIDFDVRPRSRDLVTQFAGV